MSRTRSSRTSAWRWLAMAGLVMSCPGLAQAPAGSAVISRDLAWLEGHWCGRQGEATVEEWWVLRGEALLSLGATTREGHLRSFEFMRIVDRGKQGIAFIAQPNGAPPTAFALAKLDGQSVTFSNPAHDFPQHVSYRRDATGLHAEIAGPGKSGEQRMRFDYTACPGAAP